MMRCQFRLQLLI